MWCNWLWDILNGGRNVLVSLICHLYHILSTPTIRCYFGRFQITDILSSILLSWFLWNSWLPNYRSWALLRIIITHSFETYSNFITINIANLTGIHLIQSITFYDPWPTINHKIHWFYLIKLVRNSTCLFSKHFIRFKYDIKMINLNWLDHIEM